MATAPSIPYHVLQSHPENTSSDYPSTPTISPFTLGQSMQKKSRISIAKAFMLVSVSFMVLALVHVSYSTNYTHPPQKSSTTNTNTNTNTLQQGPSPPSTVPGIEQKAPSHVLLPESKYPTETNGKPNPQDKNDDDNSNNNNNTKGSSNKPNAVITDSELTTTIRYVNGTLTKIFKPAFFQNAVAAKKEMGSFMQTLAKRTWWERIPAVKSEEEITFGSNDEADHEIGDIISNDGHREVEEGEEEEEDDDRDQRVSVSKVPGRFFTYLPMGGGNNQFTSLQKAALLAKDLKRTLILPPISPNTHIASWAGPRYSTFYDLDTFTVNSGIHILEWHDVKQTPETVPADFNHHWLEFSEDFPCIPNGGIGIKDHNLFDRFRQQFLLNFKATLLPEDKTGGTSTDFKYARDVLLKDSVAQVRPTEKYKTTDAEENSVDPQMWKCLSSPYFLTGADTADRTWSEVGTYLRFNDRTEAMADDILDVLLGPIEGKIIDEKDKTKPFRPHPQFIIVHLRRGDIVSKCPPGVDEKDCIVQIEAIAEKVDEIEKERRIAALEKHKNDKKDEATFQHKRLPVLVTTNEERAEELEKLYRLGWILLDHGDDEEKKKDGDKQGQVKSSSKSKKLGTISRFGPWYPPMLDAVLLTRGDYLIGMRKSRMSILATQRGSAWYGHKTMLM
ncbi:hypothetical protein BGX28_001244 [Mortierella sp. GBA30]|nr:hypothetical protein BGX28_001244 [Mortierella sp. GBA30]